MDQLGSNTTMIIPLKRIVKISARAVRFACFYGQAPVEASKPLPANRPTQKPSEDVHRRTMIDTKADMIPRLQNGASMRMPSLHVDENGHNPSVSAASTWTTMRSVRVPLPAPAPENPIPQSIPARKKPVIGYLAPMPPGVELMKSRPRPTRPQHVVGPRDEDDPKMTREEQINEFRRFRDAFDKQWLSGHSRGN